MGARASSATSGTTSSLRAVGVQTDILQALDQVPLERPLSGVGERIIAGFLLSAAADAIGFRNGHFEFNPSSERILAEVAAMGGPLGISLDPRSWLISDDTVMQMATGSALLAALHPGPSESGLLTDRGDWRAALASIMPTMAQAYVECLADTSDRAFGLQTIHALKGLSQRLAAGEAGPMGLAAEPSPRAGGCGAAMRSACIGVLFPFARYPRTLVALAVESGRLTHNHPVGFLGSVASALFTSLALDDAVPVTDWALVLLEEALPLAREHLSDLRSAGDLAPEEHDFLADFAYFETHLREYVARRGLSRDRPGAVTFPEDFAEPAARDRHFKAISFSGFAGGSGHDAVLIALDALLYSGGQWATFLEVGSLHGGDSDSTGAIGGFWFGARYGAAQVPAGHIGPAHLEYHEPLTRLAAGVAACVEIPEV
ncbi:hypothetical protein H696_02647 [Fonticula alba]|uniref:ADP-ribosylhydrolase ARH1 n=1 Tax=Fonticula alba TaxID=691883 RepID=A0A058Z8R1_FONAL|nr:hypothetical protein H696_02647 [Fonticula alba]KCV70318.1 hypothetical protein H696_02647 [Fonticula alba]|eukprot:XP_009494834.1 hypothetical protein H696_02647 [Fonticula alba]